MQDNDFDNFCIGINEQNKLLIYQLSKNTINNKIFIDSSIEYDVKAVFFEQKLKVLLQDEQGTFFLADQENMNKIEVQGKFIYQIQQFILFYIPDDDDKIKIIIYNIKSNKSQSFIEEIFCNIQTQPIVLFNRYQKIINILFNSQDAGFDSITFTINEENIERVQNKDVNFEQFRKFSFQDDVYTDYYKQIDYTASSFRYPLFSSKIQSQSVEVDKQIIQTEEGVDDKEYFKEVQDENSQLNKFCQNGFRYYQLLYGFNVMNQPEEQEENEEEEQNEESYQLQIIVASNKYQIRPDLLKDQMFMYKGQNIYDMSDFGPQTDQIMEYSSKNIVQKEEKEDNKEETVQKQHEDKLSKEIQEEEIEEEEEEEIIEKEIDEQLIRKQQQILHNVQQYKIDKKLYHKVIDQPQNKNNQNQQNQLQKIMQMIDQQDSSQFLQLSLKNKYFDQYIKQHNLQQTIEQLQNQLQKQQQKTEIKEDIQEKTKLDFGETKVIQVTVNQQ